MMTIPDTATLRKALEITIKIECLQVELHTLLSSASEKVVEKVPQKKRLSKKTSAPLSKTKKESAVAETGVLESPEPLQKVPQEEMLLMDDDGMEQLALRPSSGPVSGPASGSAFGPDSIPVEESCSLVHPLVH